MLDIGWGKEDGIDNVGHNMISYFQFPNCVKNIQYPKVLILLNNIHYYVSFWIPSTETKGITDGVENKTDDITS